MSNSTFSLKQFVWNKSRDNQSTSLEHLQKQILLHALYRQVVMNNQVDTTRNWGRIMRRFTLAILLPWPRQWPSEECWWAGWAKLYELIGWLNTTSSDFAQPANQHVPDGQGNANQHVPDGQGDSIAEVDRHRIRPLNTSHDKHIANICYYESGF